LDAIIIALANDHIEQLLHSKQRAKEKKQTMKQRIAANFARNEKQLAKRRKRHRKEIEQIRSKELTKAVSIDSGGRS
jgi:hypothetical protein